MKLKTLIAPSDVLRTDFKPLTRERLKEMEELIGETMRSLARKPVASAVHAKDSRRSVQFALSLADIRRIYDSRRNLQEVK